MVSILFRCFLAKMPKVPVSQTPVRMEELFYERQVPNKLEFQGNFLEHVIKPWKNRGAASLISKGVNREGTQ